MPALYSATVIRTDLEQSSVSTPSLGCKTNLMTSVKYIYIFFFFMSAKSIHLVYVLIIWGFPGGSESTCNVGQPLGQEDPLEKGMVTHSSSLAWRIYKTQNKALL